MPYSNYTILRLTRLTVYIQVLVMHAHEINSKLHVEYNTGT